MITHWSHPTWRLVHLIAYHIVETDSEAKEAFTLIQKLFAALPCQICSSHATALLSRQQRPIESKIALMRAMWQFHNAVNKRTGKRHFPWSSYLGAYRKADAGAALRSFAKVFRKLASMPHVPTRQQLSQATELLVSWCQVKLGLVYRKKRRMARSVGMNFT